MVQDPSTYADDRGLMSEKQPGLGSMYGVSAGSSPARSTFSAAQIINAPVSRFSDHATPMFGEFQEHYQAAQPYPVHYPFPSPYEQQAFSGHTSVQSSLPTQPPTPHDQYLSNDPTPRDSIPPDDFVDLTRSSVSPFQAAQYQAISEKLNAQVPILEDRALPPLPPPCADANPFNDPNTSADETNGDVSRSQSLSRQSVSGESIVAEALEFPLPPTPSQASITRYRVDSMPPMLPDINVQTRVSMNSMMGESQLGVPMPSKVPARSPLATSEIVPAPSPPEAAVVKTSQNDLSRFSIYNVEDVYGGC
ncbi:hypothetical protein CPB83DRAFT_853474 [Crepidotus variabilis]|uniref:Uncharacterized protein n=1 Tax=Crepidotus variabilis TaxID=179855 RepID=A0A9P6EHF9_9AGAR|nr:hypothetical protein CPB83DRAFT_853474 [Crepidotus variabilis]